MKKLSKHDPVFHFLAHADAGKSYAFTVRETYADGSVVQWGPRVAWPGNPKQAAGPGPVVDVAAGEVSDGDGTSTLSIVALVVAALGLIVECRGARDVAC